MTKRIVGVFVLLSSVAFAQMTELQMYAAQCDAAIGATVPGFDCDTQGIEIPPGNLTPAGAPFGPGVFCDFPARLNEIKMCDPGSRIIRLVSTPLVDIVALCRKKGQNAGFYGDIAAIQTNKITGATCFYQVGPGPSLTHVVAAPSAPTSAWAQPSAPVMQSCHQCHDNGPFIRTPFLTQAAVANSQHALPGSSLTPGNPSLGYHTTQPYWFVGDKFAAIRFTSVNASNGCTTCHRMSANKTSLGSAQDLGIRSVAMTEAQKNPISSGSPLWMTPGLTSFSSQNATFAANVASCGFNATSALNNGTVFPKTSTCSVTERGPWESLGGVLISPPASAASPLSGDVDTVARGTDNAIYTKTALGPVLFPPTPTNQTALNFTPVGFVNHGKPAGLNVISDPIIVSNFTWSTGQSQADIFVVAQGGAVFNKRRASGSWQPWVSLGGGALSNPAAVSWTDAAGVERLDVIVRGTNNVPYHSRKTATGFTPWAPMGGATYHSPTVVAGPNTSMKAFIRGTDNTLYSNTWSDASGWAGWVGWGGGITSAPVAVHQNGDVSVVVRDTNEQVYRLHNFQWQFLGGKIEGEPSAAYFANGKLVVVARSKDATTMNQLIKATIPAAGPATWIPFGGNLTAPPVAVNRLEELLLFGRSKSDGDALVWSRRQP
jgi:hypothetical protein